MGTNFHSFTFVSFKLFPCNNKLAHVSKIQLCETYTATKEQKLTKYYKIITQDLLLEQHQTVDLDPTTLSLQQHMNKSQPDGEDHVLDARLSTRPKTPVCEFWTSNKSCCEVKVSEPGGYFTWTTHNRGKSRILLNVFYHTVWKRRDKTDYTARITEITQVWGVTSFEASGRPWLNRRPWAPYKAPYRDAPSPVGNIIHTLGSDHQVNCWFYFSGSMDVKGQCSGWVRRERHRRSVLGSKKAQRG